jgi:NTE family protein
MGAIVGALIASGSSSSDIQQAFRQYFILEEDRKRDVVRKLPNMLAWFSMLSLDPRKPGIVRTDSFLKNFLEDLDKLNVEDLKIPLTIITTDYWTGEEVPITEGPLMPALRASSAIPGFFEPILHLDRVLVDGSLSNAVPFSHCVGGPEVSIAVDVAPTRSPGKDPIPSTLRASEGMFDIFFDHLVQYQIKASPPDIYHKPVLRDVGVAEFDKVKEIYEQAEASIPELKNALSAHGLLKSGGEGG